MGDSRNLGLSLQRQPPSPRGQTSLSSAISEVNKSGQNTSDEPSIQRASFADAASIYPGVALLLPDAGLHDLQHLALSQRHPRSGFWIFPVWLEEDSGDGCW